MKYSVRKVLILLAVAALLCGCVGGTAAYFTATSEPAAARYILGAVRSEMTADPEDGISLRNTGNVPVYVRVMISGSWRDAEGNIVAPWTGEIPYDTENWSSSGGCYYLLRPLPPGETAPDLLTAVLPSGEAPAMGLRLSWDILHQSIQAEPASAALDAWGWTPPTGEGGLQ